jgi:hypothetical protein
MTCGIRRMNSLRTWCLIACLFGDLPGWFADRLPVLGGHDGNRGETARALASLLRQEKPADAAPDGPARPPEAALEYIDTGFENASPLWYEAGPDGALHLHLLYDHERSSPNRAAGHIHFRLHAKPGTALTLEFRNLDNVWNGRKASVADELRTAGLDYSAGGRTSYTEIRPFLAALYPVQTALRAAGVLFNSRHNPFPLLPFSWFKQVFWSIIRNGQVTMGRTDGGRR